jgi:hypothetical protein
MSCFATISALVYVSVNCVSIFVAITITCSYVCRNRFYCLFVQTKYLLDATYSRSGHSRHVALPSFELPISSFLATMRVERYLLDIDSFSPQVILFV